MNLIMKIALTPSERDCLQEALQIAADIFLDAPDDSRIERVAQAAIAALHDLIDNVEVV